MANIVRVGGAVIDGRAWLDMMIGQKIIALNSEGYTNGGAIVGIIDLSEVSKITVKVTNGASNTGYGGTSLFVGVSIANGDIAENSGEIAFNHSSSNQVFDLTKFPKESLKSCAFACSSTSTGRNFQELQFISYE